MQSTLDPYVNKSCSDATGEFGGWTQARAHRIDLWIGRDEEGTYSAIAMNLPGVGSCGATGEEAILNAKEAIQEAIKSYLDESVPIPWDLNWELKEPLPFGGELRRIMVDG